MVSNRIDVAVVLDWATIPSRRLSIAMEAAFRVENLGGCLARHGKPETFRQPGQIHILEIQLLPLEIKAVRSIGLPASRWGRSQAPHTLSRTQ
jgi:hypothetical protein